MGMSNTLQASFVVCLQERALPSRLGDTSGISVLPVAQLSSAVDANSRAFRSGSDVIVPRVHTRNRSRNGLKTVHDLGRILGLRSATRGISIEQVKFRGSGKSFVVRAAGDQNGSNTTGDDPVETLFMRELRRRGISSDSKGSAGTDTRTKPNDDEDTRVGSSERGWSGQGGPKTKPSEWTASRNDDQLKRSMALNSEGLEGLIPRATELLKLGGTFWIVFWPLILASLATFVTLYVYFGSNFLHAGTSIYAGGRPPYVEPYQLLEEETIPSEIGPNRVPFRSNPTP